MPQPDTWRLAQPVQRALSCVAHDAQLTPVLELRFMELALGLTYEDIAQEHEISINTVKTEVRILLQSLGARCRHEIESAANAAQLRGEAGATTEEIYHFLRLRFE